MNAVVRYEDKLVRIDGDILLLKNCYFPFGSRRLGLSEIEKIVVKKPTLWNGKYRIYGSSNLRTWFPPDWLRPSRGKIYEIILRGRWHRIGFTVEDEETVERILREKVRLEEERPAASGPERPTTR
jgi:hypothetical protein